DQDATAAYWGPVLDADRLRGRAGIAALEGRANEALAGYLEALRAYNQLDLPFEEAACAVDMAVTLPGIERESPAAAAAIASARETLARLGAAPWLARLDAGTRDGGRKGSRETSAAADTVATTGR